MAATSRCVDLKVNKSLLDSSFDGYKLSLDPLPMYKVNLDSCLDEVELSDNQYSFQHIKAFGLHNYLTIDPWNEDTVYYVDNAWKIVKTTVKQESNIGTPESVLELPEAGNRRLAPGRLAVTLHFPSQDWLVIADGTGHCHIVHTGDRSLPDSWKICHSQAPLGDAIYFTLIDSRITEDKDRHQLHCLFLHIDKNEDNDNKSQAFHTVLEWITFSSVDDKAWVQDRSRRLQGYTCPDYAVFSHDATALLVSSQKPFTFEHDSVVPVVKETKGLDKPTEPEGPAYVWYQDDEDLTVQFTVPSNVTKQDIEFKLSPQTLDVGLCGDHSLLTGVLENTVDISASTWTIENGRIEVVLSKAVAGKWSTVVKGDERGEMVVDPKTAADIHERLAHVTSDTWNPEPQDGKMAYNSQQLEECDAFPDDTAVMLRFDAESHQVTHQINVGSHQWLFNCQVSKEGPLSICLRHDVDGVLWQPLKDIPENQSPWDHIATFHALGYVQASKTQRKFAGCAPDFSYACIVDSVRHAYIYRQPSPILSPIRNRKTGREVKAVSKQQVIALESVENIMGFQCTNERIYLIAGRILYVVKVHQQE